MTTSVDFLESEIYEIQEIWTRQEDLQYTNDVLKSLPKGLQFFCPVSPLESPKVMGLKGIHYPDALCCFAGLTFYPWCGKEGQKQWNHGQPLVDNALQAGAVCGRCLCFP